MHKDADTTDGLFLTYQQLYAIEHVVCKL